MPERIPWNEYEAALLLRSLVEVLEHKKDKKDAIRRVSYQLRAMAKNQGKIIDDAYRNEAGITFQMSGLEGVLLNGKTPIGRRTTWMTNICDLYHNDPHTFDDIVRRAEKMCETEAKSGAFWKWLAQKNTEEQVIRLQAGYHDLNMYGCNGKPLSKKLDEITDIFELERIQALLEHDVVFRFKYRRMLEPMQEVLREYLMYKKQSSAEIKEIGLDGKQIECGLANQSCDTKNEKKPVEKIVNNSTVASSMSLEEEGCAWQNQKTAFVNEKEDSQTTKPETTTKDAAEIPPEAGVIIQTEMVRNRHTKEIKKDGIVDFDCTQYDKFDSIRPKSFEYFGEKTTVTLWQPLYIGVCKKLAEDYPNVFVSHDGAAIIGSKPELAKTSGIRQMRQPRSIYRMENGEWFFAETYFRPSEILLRIKTLMDWCNVDYENLIVEYETPKSSTRSVIHPDVIIEQEQSWLPYAEWAKQSGFEKKEIDNDLLAFQKLNEIIEKEELSDYTLTQIRKVFVLERIWYMIESTQEWSALTLENKKIAKAAIGRYTQYCANNGKVYSREKRQVIELGKQALTETVHSSQVLSGSAQSNTGYADTVNSAIRTLKEVRKRKADFLEWGKQSGYSNAEMTLTFYNLELMENTVKAEKTIDKEILSIDDAMELDCVSKTLQSSTSWEKLSDNNKNGIKDAVKCYSRYLIQDKSKGSRINQNEPSAEVVKEVANSIFSVAEKDTVSKTTIPENRSKEESKPLNEKECVLDLSDIPYLAFTRPVSMELLGQDYKVHLWKDVYVLTVKELYSVYAEKFDAITGNPKNGTGLYIDTVMNAYKMRSPKQLTRSSYGKTLFIETNKNATSIAESLKNILDLCECGYNLLRIRYEKTNTDEVELPGKRSAQSVQKWENVAAQAARKNEEGKEIYTSTLKTPTTAFAENAVELNVTPIGAIAGIQAEKLESGVTLSKKQQHYADLLRDEFPDGFKDGSVIACKKMLIAYQNKYGEEPSESKSEIFEIVRQVGTLRDGRVYPKTHSQLLSEINDEIIDLLNTGATCVYCDAVFERYRIQLAEEQHIYNAEALREPLVSLSRGRYVTKWGMFCLPDRDADISMDVLFCMRKHPAPTTYDELQDELWYIPLDKIKKALMDDPAMVNVGDGTYFYAPNLPVSKEELHLLSSYMESELGYHSYATTKQLMQLIHEKCPTIEINTEGFSTLAVRNSLSYLLRKEFNFRGNIISLATTQPPVDTKQAFCEFCRERETMTTDELQAFADEVDSVIYWDSVFSEMVRVSEHDWVRKDQIRWTPEAIDAKLDEMCEGDYLIIKDICLFLQFPVVDYRWNSFLLESYVNTYSPNYMLLHTSFSVYDCCGAIVKKTSSIHDYHDLAVDVLAKDTNWNDQQSALQVLVDKGLQQRKKLADIAQVVKEARLKREKRQKEST